jgi:hypothetical protein
MHPVYPYFSPELYVDDLVGFVVAILPWDSYTNVLPEGVNGMVVVLHTHVVPLHLPARWPRRHLPGEGDHDTSYDYMEVDTEFAPFMQHNFPTPASTASMISVSSF